MEKNNRKGKEKETDTLTITLWDLPKWYMSGQIKRLTKHLGWSKDISFFETRQGKGAVVKLEYKEEEQIQKINETWALGLEDGSLTRLTPGEQDFEVLRNRREHSTTLVNVSPNASETLILRAARNIKAKSVYIPYNSNRNTRAIAWVYFENETSKRIAKRKGINYYNTKLYWKKSPEEEYEFSETESEKDLGENSNIQHKATEKSTSNRELERLEEKQNRNLYLSETARHRESNNEEDMWKGKQNFKYQNTKYLTYSS